MAAAQDDLMVLSRIKDGLELHFLELLGVQEGSLNFKCLPDGTENMPGAQIRADLSTLQFIEGRKLKSTAELIGLNCGFKVTRSNVPRRSNLFSNAVLQQFIVMGLAYPERFDFFMYLKDVGLSFRVMQQGTNIDMLFSFRNERDQVNYKAFLVELLAIEPAASEVLTINRSLGSSDILIPVTLLDRCAQAMAQAGLFKKMDGFDPRVGSPYFMASM